MVALFINSKITFNDIDTFKRKRNTLQKIIFTQSRQM
jgi:hypothetical protein